MSFSCSMLAPCFANLSACSLHLIPQCAGIHYRITLLCSNMLYSLHLRLCSPCPASGSNTDRESVRNTTSSELISVVSSWFLVTVGIVVRIVRSLLVYLDDMGGGGVLVLTVLIVLL